MTSDISLDLNVISEYWDNYSHSIPISIGPAIEIQSHSDNPRINIRPDIYGGTRYVESYIHKGAHRLTYIMTIDAISVMYMKLILRSQYTIWDNEQQMAFHRKCIEQCASCIQSDCDFCKGGQFQLPKFDLVTIFQACELCRNIINRRPIFGYSVDNIFIYQEDELICNRYTYTLKEYLTLWSLGDIRNNDLAKCNICLNIYFWPVLKYCRNCNNMLPYINELLWRVYTILRLICTKYLSNDIREYIWVMVF